MEGLTGAMSPMFLPGAMGPSPMMSGAEGMGSLPPPPPGPPPPGMPPMVLPMLPPGLELVPMPVSSKLYAVEATSGQECTYGRTCKSVQCPDSHPNGRDDPCFTLCRFNRKCKRVGCYFAHPNGREVDEDPSKGLCRQGLECKRPDCLYSHPPGREQVGNEARVCHLCGQTGHIMRDCTRPRKRYPVPQGQHVSMTDLPQDWLQAGPEKIASNCAAELESFGSLVLQPFVLDHGREVVASFSDKELAKSAVEGLNGSLCRIELIDTPPPGVYPEEPDIQPEGKLLIEGFPQRWGVADITTLIHGAVRPSNVLGIELLTAEDALEGSVRVRLRDFSAAKEAAKEMSGQKVAGKALRIIVEGAVEEEEDRRCRSRDRGRRSRPRGGGGYSGRRSRERDRDRDRDRDRERDRERDRGEEEVQRGGGGERDNQAWRPGDQKDNGYEEERRRWGGGNDWGRERERERERPRVLTIHLDELPMPRRPQVEPSPSDRELFVDPLPEEEMMETCLAAFGDADDVFRIPDPKTGRPSNRGYVKFKEHAAAVRAAEADFGAWSESERTLSSQRSKRSHDGSVSTYPDSVIARIVGSRGEAIRRMQDECGASWLHLRGEDLGHTDHKSDSQRVHFIAEGDERAFARLREVLARRLAEIHDAICERLEQDKREGDRRGSGQDDDRDRNRRDRLPADGIAWQPPDMPWKPPVAPCGMGPPPGGPPPGPPGFWPGGGPLPGPPPSSAPGAWTPPLGGPGPPPSNGAWRPPVGPPGAMPPPPSGMPPLPGLAMGMPPLPGMPPWMGGPHGNASGMGPPPGWGMPPGIHGAAPGMGMGPPPGWGEMPMPPGGLPQGGLPGGGAEPPREGDRSRRQERDRRRRRSSSTSRSSGARKRRRRH